MCITYEYEKITPFATYSPWKNDRSFNAILEAINGFTLIDKYRCYELWKLVEQSAKLPEGDIIEVGVWRGGSGAIIACKAKACKIPSLVHLCDTFTGVVKAGPNDSRYKGGEHCDTSMQIVEDLVFKRLGLDNIKIWEGIFPEHTSNALTDRKFRFCHIDVDVYQSAKDIIDWIWTRLVHGGIIVFDDYGFEGCDGITRFVEEQIA